MRVESGTTGNRGFDVEAPVAVLNKFLRGELSAVETYRQALERMKNSVDVGDLNECKRSHETRVEILRSQILQLGGEPSHSSGAWGSFAKLVEGSATVFGEKAAIAALEEGEDHGLKLYRDRSDLEKLDAATRDVIERTLLPEQERTHRAMSAIKHRAH